MLCLSQLTGEDESQSKPEPSSHRLCGVHGPSLTVVSFMLCFEVICINASVCVAVTMARKEDTPTLLLLGVCRRCSLTVLVLNWSASKQTSETFHTSCVHLWFSGKVHDNKVWRWAEQQRHLHHRMWRIRRHQPPPVATHLDPHHGRPSQLLSLRVFL